MSQKPGLLGILREIGQVFAERKPLTTSSSVLTMKVFKLMALM